MLKTAEKPGSSALARWEDSHAGTDLGESAVGQEEVPDKASVIKKAKAKEDKKHKKHKDKKHKRKDKKDRKLKTVKKNKKIKRDKHKKKHKKLSSNSSSSSSSTAQSEHSCSDESSSNPQTKKRRFEAEAKRDRQGWRLSQFLGD